MKGSEVCRWPAELYVLSDLLSGSFPDRSALAPGPRWGGGPAVHVEGQREMLALENQDGGMAAPRGKPACPREPRAWAPVPRKWGGGRELAPPPPLTFQSCIVLLWDKFSFT